MNPNELIDYVVIEVLSEPRRYPYGYTVKCLIKDESGIKRERIHSNTLEDAKKIQVGYKGQH